MLKTGKTKREIAHMVKNNSGMLEQGDFTSRYSEMMMTITKEDLSGDKDKSKDKVDTIMKEAENSQKVIELNIADLSESPKNHFSKAEGEKREALLGSLSAYGQINPIFVRPKECIENYTVPGKYEILIGHTRVDCLSELQKKKVKAIIVKCDDVEATLMINQSNIQREKVSPLELALAYKETYETYKKDKNANLMQGNVRNEKISSEEESNRTDEKVASFYGISKNTFLRKMALAYCTEDIVKLFNQKKITQEELQDISKLDASAQNEVAEIVTKEQLALSKKITKELKRKFDNKEEEYETIFFPRNVIKEIMEKGQAEIKEKEKRKVKKKDNSYIIPEKMFPKGLKKKERNKYLIKALEYISDHNIELVETEEKSIENRDVSE